MDFTTEDATMTAQGKRHDEDTAETAPPISSVIDLANRLDRSANDGKTKVLGYLVWWDAEGAEALMDDVTKHVEVVGLPKAACPSIEARGGLKKALEAMGLRASPQSGKKASPKKSKKGKKSQQQAATPEDDARLFYDRLVDDSERIVMAISERVVDDADGTHPVARYVERQTITYNREAKAISCSSGFLKTEIDTGFEKYVKTYRANEIRTVIQNVLDKHAKAVRVRDGVYFVPRPLVSWVEKLRDLASKIAGVKLTKVSILDVAGGEHEDMRELAGAAIKGELVALAGDLEKLQAAKAEGVTTRDSTYEARLARFSELREKARVYQDLLAIETGDIETGLADLTTKVEALMTGGRKKR